MSNKRGARGIKVRFEAAGVPRDLPSGVSLCIYRVAQEAIQNTVKHSGASIADVRLSAEDGEIVLAVSDNSYGYNPADLRKNRDSLGPISMDERVRSSHGTLTIESVLSAGTKVQDRVPINRSHDARSGQFRSSPSSNSAEYLIRAY